MKRMRRIIFNILTALSLLLCAAMATLWVRSHQYNEDISCVSDVGTTRTRWLKLSTMPDGFTLGLQQLTFRPENRNQFAKLWKQIHPKRPFQWHVISLSRSSPLDIFIRRESGLWDFGASKDTNTIDDDPFPPGLVCTIWNCQAPFWAPILAFLILPLLAAGRWLHRRRRRQRSRQGYCYGCGYDLRATPEQCPECGALAAKVAM